jgi:hypothetical protein
MRVWNRNGRLSLAENGQMRLQWFHDKAGNVMAEQQHDLKGSLNAIKLA